MDFRLLLVLFVLAPLAARAIDRDEERTFAVEPGCTLKVDLFRGAIDVRETDAAEITVVAHLSLAAKTPEEADRLVAALGFAATQEGDTVSVRASDPEGSGVRFTWDEKSRVNLECQIFVPRRCSVELRTREGPVTVGNLAGRVFVRTNRGNVFIRRIDGTIDAATKSGDLIVSRCSGAVTAATEYGTLRVGTLGGRAVLRNGGGDIEVLEAHASLDVEAEVGDVTVGLPNDFAGEAKVRTAYGSIFAKIDPTANCVVQASSFWGHVENKLPLAIEAGGDGKGKLTGRLNAGGSPVTLHANGGHVFLQRGDSYFN
jgi:hypothetical protein